MLSESPADFSLFYCWIKPIFWYVVYCLHSNQRDRPYWIPPAKANHLNISRKILLGTVRAADIFIPFPPLDQAYFWICDASGCDTHFERWRLEIKSPATFSQVSFGIIEICGDPTVKLC